jgi:hypothetical protein
MGQGGMDSDYHKSSVMVANCARGVIGNSKEEPLNDGPRDIRPPLDILLFRVELGTGCERAANPTLLPAARKSPYNRRANVASLLSFSV